MFNYQPPANLLNDKIILVTGASQGIGKAACLSFAQHGATVLMLARNTKLMAAIYDEIIAAGGPEPAIIPYDLSHISDESLHELAEQIQNDYGRLDGLLNNAGVLGFKGPLRDTETDQWQQTLNINLTAGFMLTRTLLPLLEAASNASVIFTSSGVGRRGRAYWGAYSVSKFGIEGLTQVLADEYDTIGSIRFNVVNPGVTDTLMRRAAYPGENPANNPAPAEVLPVYLYLMGDDSLGVNGESLDAQGG